MAKTFWSSPNIFGPSQNNSHCLYILHLCMLAKIIWMHNGKMNAITFRQLTSGFWLFNSCQNRFATAQIFLNLAKINLVLHKLQYCYIYPFQLAKIVRMHNGKMNAIMLAIVEMEAAFATLASKDTNVKWNVRPTIQPSTPLSFTQNQGIKNMLKSYLNFI